jgi:ubiquinone/menaquinone biosynthesis C-methylase UbiE
MTINTHQHIIKTKYKTTAKFYDLLDWPWEFFVYRKLRPQILDGISGKVLEAGVGTGRNLVYYNRNVDLIGIDLSFEMLLRAKKRQKLARCNVNLIEADATNLSLFNSNYFDWVVSTFLCCVMPNNLQSIAINEFARVLKPGGKFKLVEIVYSNQPGLYRKQKLMSAYVEKVFGAKFDRNTLEVLSSNKDLTITSTKFIKDDTYLLIEGSKK